MASLAESSTVRFALPKGRMEEGVRALLADAGIRVRVGSCEYRPTISLPGFEVKILKPQNIVEMVHFGSRDLGFAGADWVAELGAEVVELLDTGLDEVSLVAAAPSALLRDGKLPDRSLVVASEYERLTRAWITRRGMHDTFVRTYGATEVFPPEDADCIVDNTASGSTLRPHQLVIVDTLMLSSTRLFANKAALDAPQRRDAIETLVWLLRSVLQARTRVMVEVNVPAASLEAVISALPCMREPTVSMLHGDAGYSVKAAVPRIDLPRLIPEIKARGGSDIVVTALTQIVA